MTTYDVELRVPADCGIEAAGETVSLAVESSETVLSAARAAGVWLPADCQQGCVRPVRACSARAR